MFISFSKRSCVLASIVLVTSLCSAAFAAGRPAEVDLTFLSEKEGVKPGNCAIMGHGGVSLITDKVRINGVPMKVEVVSISTQSMSWQGKNFTATFTMGKGVLPLKANGDKTVGYTPWGKVSFTYEGIKGLTEARMECFN